MISMKKVASAVGGKTARACDSCIKKRARWYCAADDAFLCQACDSSVHSANLLARRHERVRLNTASTEPAASSVEPLWHRGFKTKPRTPRKSKLKRVEKNLIHLVVPEMGQDENYLEANDEHEQLLYQVPILETFADHLCLPERDGSRKRAGNDEDGKYLSGTGVYDRTCNKDVNSLCGFSTETNMDIEELAADVENLFRKGLDEDSFDMETLGFLEKYSHESCTSIETVKVEDEGNREFNMGDIAQIDITAETFELNFDDYKSPGNCEEDIKAEGNGVTEKQEFNYDDDLKVKKKNKLLALDYEGVISAWADKKTPWMIGDGRPELDLRQCWPDCMDDFGRAIYGGSSRNNITAAAATTTTDSGREARVSRYREKRRRRLFSKKIRYEVRKLNAEKRPRIKGRFVRRPTNMAPN